MTKYNELVKTYRDEIESIKQLRNQLSKLSEQMDVARQCENLETQADIAEKIDQCAAADSDLSEKLYQELIIEYGNCPFPQVANQGIARFYEVAGLSYY